VEPEDSEVYFGSRTVVVVAAANAVGHGVVAAVGRSIARLVPVPHESASRLDWSDSTPF